jgi:predicted protein tyrosine phosphatase
MSLEVDRALINSRIDSKRSVASREVRIEGLLIIRLSPLRSRKPIAGVTTWHRQSPMIVKCLRSFGRSAWSGLCSCYTHVVIL